MVTIIDSSTPDDDLRKDRFIKTFNMPGSQMHFRPDRIIEMDDDRVTMQGVEGSSNNKVNVVMLRSVFDTMVENQPKARFLVDNWNKANKPRTGSETQS